MVNRIFNRKEIADHFPFFIKWLKAKKIEYPHTFDFIYFKKWILEESQQNLERNIALLHKTFFWYNHHIFLSSIQNMEKKEVFDDWSVDKEVTGVRK